MAMHPEPVPPPGYAAPNIVWRQPVSVGTLAALHQGALRRGALSRHPEVEFLEVGDDFIRGRMRIDERVLRSYGTLHGGASIALAETLCACAAAHASAPGHEVMAMEIAATHVRRVDAGWLTGTARPLHLGNGSQVWQASLAGAEGRLAAVARITLAILPR